MNTNSGFKGAAAALAANTIFGFSFIFGKMALKTAHPLIILSVRFIIAFAVMNILLLSGRIKINLKGRKKGKLIAMGIAQPLVYFLCELYGLSLVSSALSGVIIALAPVAVMLLAAVFLGEKPSLLQAFCTVLSIVGVAAISVVSNDGAKSHTLGVLLLLAAVLSSAVFNILSRSQSAEFSPFERTYVMFSIGAVGFTAVSAAVLRSKFVPELLKAFSSAEFWIAMFYLAVLSSVAAFLLYNYSTTRISAIRSSSFSNIITVVSVLAGVFILGESFNALQFVLCGLIILGVWGTNITKDK